MVEPCVKVSSTSEPCVTARIERVGKPCVTVSSKSEPCVTSRVERVVKPRVTDLSKSGACVTARVECEKKPGATVSNELCITARVREGDEPGATVQSRREEELTKTIAQGAEESHPYATLPIKKRVSWPPLSSEEDNSAERAEQGGVGVTYERVGAPELGRRREIKSYYHESKKQ